MQDLSAFDGVDIEAAVAVCAQYGARLVSSSSLEEMQDLLEGESIGGVRVHIQAKETDIHHLFHQKVIGHTNLFTFTSARNV